MRLLRSILGVALAYAILGKLGLALAIPPGYASPVFPAAGIAVALALHFGNRILLGVWLGSFVLNLSVAWQTGSITATGALVSISLACGATFQAWGARKLVLRWMKDKWRYLESEQDIASFLVITAPLACLISATVGAGTLVVAEVVDPAEFLFSWWNWWIGDTLGVLTFAPLTLIFLLQRESSWQNRLMAVGAPMVVTLGLVTGVFLWVARWDRQLQIDQIEAQGNKLSQLLDHRFVAHQEVLSALGRLIHVMPDMSYRQFEYFTRITLQDNPDIYALSFNSYVRHSSRPAFEQAMRSALKEPNFRITERNSKRQMVPAADRDHYVAVGFIAPREGNSQAVGFDINSDPIRHDAIERARKSGIAAVTAPIRLVQEQRERPAVLVLQPLADIRSLSPRASVTQLTGFAVAVLKVDQMVRLAISRQLPAGLVLRVSDEQLEGGSGTFFRSDGGYATPVEPFSWRTQLAVADRVWTLHVFPTAEYLREHRSTFAWAVGIAGLMFAALLQFMMLVMTGRAAVISRKVDEQTVELKVANQQLIEAKKAADSANVAKSAFLAMMSHEIRTPMNGILGMAQLLELPDLKESDRQDYARTIIKSGDTLLTLLNDILDLSKVEAGKLELESDVFEPERIVQDTWTLFAEPAAAKSLRLEHAWSGPAGRRYLGDSHRIRQMLANLVTNSIKFTERGHIRIEAREVECSGTTATLEFSVSDTGIGILEDKLPQLFQPFSQVDSSTTRHYGGTGLGLSIVRSFAERMGGGVGVESRYGHGSRFWFRIRANLVGREDGNHHQDWLADVEAGSGPRISRFAGRVLVVDDDPTNRKVIAAMLSKLGVDVVVAEDGLQGVDAIVNDPRLDLVLMDIRMPVMDGYAATSRIRSWETGEHRSPVPIVALTASAFEEDRQQSRRAGMNDFLVKPISFAELSNILSKWLVADSASTTAAARAGRAPELAVPAGGDAVFDEQALLRLFGGDRGLAAAVIGSVIETIPGNFDKLEQAVAVENWADAERMVHTAKGLVSQVGGIGLAACLANAETTLHDGGRIDAAVVAEFRRELGLLLERLRTWLE